MMREVFVRALDIKLYENHGCVNNESPPTIPYLNSLDSAMVREKNLRKRNDLRMQEERTGKVMSVCGSRIKFGYMEVKRDEKAV